MARIDRQRLDTATFPVTSAIQTRFTDLDTQGHVNNAAAAVILQEARVALNRTAGFSEIRAGLRPVVAALHIEYVDEMHHHAPVEVSTGLLAIGRTSVVVGQKARQEGRTTLYAETVLVMTTADGPTEIPPALRDAYAGVLIRLA